MRNIPGSNPESMVLRGIFEAVMLITIAFLIPVSAPLIGLALLIWGAALYQRSTVRDARTRSIIFVISGLVLILITILFLATRTSLG